MDEDWNYLFQSLEENFLLCEAFSENRTPERQLLDLILHFNMFRGHLDHLIYSVNDFCS